MEIKLDNFEREKHSLDVIITGIPNLDSYTPLKNFHNICTALNYYVEPK